MGLKILTENDPITVSQLVVCIQALPGIGKTSIGFTGRDALLIDFDKGVHRSKNRRKTAVVETWDDVLQIDDSVLSNYKTVVLDTAGRALEMLTTSIIDEDPKMGKKGGGLQIQGWGALGVKFAAWVSYIKSRKKDLVFLCHVDEKQNGDKIKENLDVKGGSKNEIHKSCDIMGRLYLQEGNRFLDFNPCESSFGKNPVGLAPIKVPDFAEEPEFLGNLIESIKGKLSEMSEVQRKTAEIQDFWRNRVVQATEAEEYTTIRNEIISSEESDATKGLVRSLLASTMVAKKLDFDPKSKCFVKVA